MKDDKANRIIRLAKSAKNDDTNSFDELLEIFSPTIATLSGTFNLPEGEHDDLCQEGRMALYRAVKSYDESRGASFTTYAVACISNALVNFVKRYNTLCVPFGKTEEINDDIPESDTTDGIVFSNNLSNMLYVMKGFANLSENERNVLVMKLGGFKNKEISEKTGKTPKSVDNTLFRARKKLRDYLGL